jgi:hypothetical protein
MFKTIFATITLATAITSAPITVVEPPDLPDSGGPTFTLAPGINTISGSVNGCPNCGGDFQDDLTLFLPVGLIVTEASLSANINAPTGPNASGACFSNTGCFFLSFFSGLPTSSFDNPDRTLNFTASSPYSAPSVQIPGSSSNVPSYTVTASTRGGEVPEPGSWLLLSSGLAFVALRRYKTVSGTVTATAARLDVNFSRYK